MSLKESIICTEYGQTSMAAKYKVTKYKMLDRPIRCYDCVRKESVRRANRAAMRRRNKLIKKESLSGSFAKAFKDKTGRDLNI